MSNTKHTPGPWRTAHHGEWITGKDAAHGEVVVAKAEFNWQANTHLIAAAPDLLAALEAYVSADDEVFGDAIGGATRDRARAAIAKATGGAV